ncbi:MAG: hypothetical protein WBQ94_12835 [Terracidiphilus sp.]
MTSSNWLLLIQLLRSASLEFEPGLTDPEVEHIENRFDFRFPADLRLFLQAAVPLWNSPRWRTGSETDLQIWLDEPMKGLLFDVEHNDFWFPEWGMRPEELADALKIAHAKISEAPKLIPILGNRYMPTKPGDEGNPVFSVHQADIIYYGFDLEDYLRHEFNLPRRDWPAHVKEIEFWDPDRFQRIRWGDDPPTLID